MHEIFGVLGSLGFLRGIFKVERLALSGFKMCSMRGFRFGVSGLRIQGFRVVVKLCEIGLRPLAKGLWLWV